MRREGRQHGMVLYREIYPGTTKPKTRILNQLQTVPTTSFMTKVSSKPTSHSRYTERWPNTCGCALCSSWSLPVNKSRGKAKGTHKLRHSSDVTVNHLLVSQRLVGPVSRARWVRFDHGSANWLLDQLIIDDDDDCYSDADVDDYCDYNEYDDHEVGGNDDLGFCFVEFVRELKLNGEDDWSLIGDI